MVWERNQNKRYAIQLKRRVRAILHLPVKKEDFDHTDLEKFGLGTKRTLEQWKEFSGTNPLAKFVSPDDAQFDNYKQIMYVSLLAHDSLGQHFRMRPSAGLANDRQSVKAVSEVDQPYRVLDSNINHNRKEI